MRHVQNIARRSLMLVAVALATSFGLVGMTESPVAACDAHAKQAAKASTQPAESGVEASGSNALVHQGQARVGDRTLCPIMGGEFEVTAESPSFEHDGQTIFFCCAGCNEAFARDADNLLSAVNTRIGEANAAVE